MNPTPASYYYDDIRRCLQAVGHDVRRRSEMAYRLLVELLNESTSAATVTFSGPFSRLHYLCRQLGVSEELYDALNGFRVRCGKTGEQDEAALAAHLPGDLSALAKLVSAAKKTPIPSELVALLPKHITAPAVPAAVAHRSLRVVVSGVAHDGLLIRAADVASNTEYRLSYVDDGREEDFSYLRDIAADGMQLNLIFPKADGRELHPRLVILEPDYLLNVTSVTRCFLPTGAFSAWHPIRTLASRGNTPQALLGELCGEMLDEEMHGEENAYAVTLKKFFADHALRFLEWDENSTMSRSEFHAEARRQQHNLRMLVAHQFKTELGLHERSDALLEPSFYCEMLGLQGRVDLMKRDGSLIVEQKSGKFDEFRHREREEHLLQLLLYMAMQHYVFRRPYAGLQAYLLYSRYVGKEALWKMQNVPRLLREAFRIRNEIVAREFRFAAEGMRPFIEGLTPDALHAPGMAPALWNKYTRIEAESFLSVFRDGDPVALSYFYRFHRFLTREGLLSRLGTASKEASGFAAAWQCTTAEKREVGAILTDLTLAALPTGASSETVEEVRLTLPAPADDDDRAAPSKFEAGDIVVLYDYDAAQEPDLRRGMVLRATISRIDAREVVLSLRAPQTDPRVFSVREGRSWAIEPDFMAAGGGAQMRSLFRLLAMPSQRRDWLLGRETVRVSADAPLLTQPRNAELCELVRKVKCAQDLFLLVGPPGTGKTSMGLMSILREELADPSRQVLLGAYTNRAVDEICGKMVADGIDFVRVGNESSTDPEYRSRLLSCRVSLLEKLADVEQLIRDVRVVVGTTHSLASADSLFREKHFSLAIIDEASQLLEPQLLPLLVAGDAARPAIEKFVLIGDHRQLPAVVQQSAAESAVEAPELRAIGLTDCRRSFFERFIDRVPPACRHDFTRQGRMHPDVAAFSSRHFYGGRLCAIPLPHQEEATSEPRVVFYDCPPDVSPIGASPKSNPAEARLIVRLALREWQRAMDECGTFDADRDLGIIVPYRRQIAAVRDALARSSRPELAAVTIDTVERYQGSERRSIIYGFTVSRMSQLSFLCDAQFVDEQGQQVDRKLNVALTRAKERLLLVGHADLLRRDPLFAALIDSYDAARIGVSPP